MIVVLEEGDAPETRNLVYSLLKCGIDFAIVEETTETYKKQFSDNQIKEAIISVMPYFSVKSQWVAIYRILVDFMDYPSEITAFFKRINHIMHGTHISFAPDYQAIQKPLAASSILQKHYRHWLAFEPVKGDRIFERQRMIAEKFMHALGIQ